MTSLLATGFYAQAQNNISYSYLEAGYNYSDVDGGGNSDGPYFLGSFDLNNSFYLGGYYDRDSTNSTRSLDIDEYGVFLGYHFSQSDRTDFYAELNTGRIDREAEVTITNIGSDGNVDTVNTTRDFNSTIYGVDIGTRTAYTKNIELISKIGYVYNDRASDGFFKFGVKGLFKFGQHSGITVGLETIDSDELVGSIGYRYSL